MFAIIIESKEVLDQDKDVLTHDGDRFLVVEDYDDGYVTSDSCYPDMTYHKDTLIFNTAEDAKRFAKKWKGHPWWVVPNGNYEIIELEPAYKQVIVGYVVKKPQLK